MECKLIHYHDIFSFHDRNSKMVCGGVSHNLLEMWKIWNSYINMYIVYSVRCLYGLIAIVTLDLCASTNVHGGAKNILCFRALQWRHHRGLKIEVSNQGYHVHCLASLYQCAAIIEHASEQSKSEWRKMMYSCYSTMNVVGDKKVLKCCQQHWTMCFLC